MTCAGGVLDRGHGYGDIDSPTVLANMLGFKGPHVLPLFDAFQNRGDLVQLLGGNEQRDRLADDLRRRVTEDSLRAGIPARDDALQSAPDDGICRGIDNGGQPLCGLLAPLPLGDVFDRQQDQIQIIETSGVEPHRPLAEFFEVVLNLEIVEGGVPGKNVLQQFPQPQDVPLPQVKEKTAFGLFRCYLEGPVE